MKTDLHLELGGKPTGKTPFKGVFGVLILTVGLWVIASFTRIPLLASTPDVKLAQASVSPKTTPPALSSTPVLSPQPGNSNRLSTTQLIAGQTQVDPYTVALYHFDSQNGTTVLDASSNHFDGTLYGNAVITTDGLYGGALQLDGAGSYMQTSYLGSLNMGTIEAFIDFRPGCYTADEYFTVFSASGTIGGQPAVLALRTQPWLDFGIFANGQWQWVTSEVNTCRYLAGGDQSTNFGIYGLPVRWPYETWRFHHVAGTWGPRGLEIWIDGVLHGIGVLNLNYATPPIQVLPNYACNPQNQVSSVAYPRCDKPVVGTVSPGSYQGGVPPYNSFMIGCDVGGSCIRGRIDEVRISNIQRTFDWTVDPTSSPTPSQTPVAIREYSVDPNTLALYHFNYETQWNQVYEEVSAVVRGLGNNMGVVPQGRFNAGLSVNASSSEASMGSLGSPHAGSFEAWINLTSVPGSMTVVGGKEYWNSPSEKLLLGTWPSPANTMRFGIDDGYQMNWADSRVNVSAFVGSWHHVAGTWGDRGIEVWVDGKLCGTNGYPVGLQGPVFEYFFGCGLNGNCVQGTMDEVRVSSVQRTFSRLALGITGARSSNGAAPSGGTGLGWFLPFISINPSPTPSYINCP